LAFSYWFDKPRFLTEGRLATVLIVPSSWGSQLGGYPAHIKHFFWRHCRGKRRFLQGESRTHNLLLCFSFTLLYFCLHHFIKKHKKISFLIVVVFTCLLLALLEWELMRTPSCVILLAVTPHFL
jgi:hypothetical protein